MEILFYFFLYSCIGWICEDIYCGIAKRKFINRGFLYGPYCPIYGCGSLIVIYLLTPFKAHPLLIFIGGVIFTSLLEYVTSWIMEVLFHERWWDYSSYHFNINGRVCLRNSLLFGVMAFVLMYVVHPYIISIYQKWNGPILNGLLLLISLLFMFDIFATVKHMLERKDVALSLHQAIEKAKIQFENEEQQIYQEHREAFIEWAKKNPEIAEKFLQIHHFENTHLSKAFPDRIIIKKEINDLIKEFKKTNHEKN